MRKIASIAAAVIALGVVAPPGPAAGDETKAPEIGVKVGGKAPAFTLKDQDGKERSLADLLKQGKVALVFYRSASW
ncbi:MAG TPA: redoxin domain-containing protein [Gemmataceae bacterium]